MEDASEILNQIRKIDFRHMYYSEEDNFVKSRRYREDPYKSNLELFRRFASLVPPMDPIERRDLGNVKYYGPSDLEEITEGFSEKNFLAPTLFGRLYRGKVGQGSDSREIVVKMWDFYFNPHGTYSSHIVRFADEIELLMREESKVNETLLKLVGYCFEKKVAVVYDFKPKGILRDELGSVTFDWTSRIRLTFKLACLLQSLHDKFMVLGAISSRHILIDEENNTAFFEFGLLRKLDEGTNSISTTANNLLPCYVWLSPEAIQGVWYMKSDVFAFGVLLFELISGIQLQREKRPGQEGMLWSDVQGKDAVSHVNPEFNQDADTCIAVSRLAVSCLAPNPDDRPDMHYVVNTLKPFVEVESNSSKKQKI